MVALGILYSITRIFGLTLRYNTNATYSSSSFAPPLHNSKQSSVPPSTASVVSKDGTAPYQINIIGFWFDKALQYWVVGMCANLQYVHLMQAAWIYLFCVGRSRATLAGTAAFSCWHLLLGSMPSTMLMAILSTMSKAKDGQFTPLQQVCIILTLTFPLLKFYMVLHAAENEYPDGFFMALCINYGAHLYYMTSFFGSPQLMQRRRWSGFINWTPFWSLIARYYPHKLRVDVVPNSRAHECLKSKESLFVAGWHPHGILPITPSWFQFSSAWRNHPWLKNVSLALCSSTINHLVPHMRELVQWTGGIEVGYSKHVS